MDFDHPMDERDRSSALPDQELRNQISAGYDSLARGESIDGDEFFAALQREEEELARKGA